MTAKILVVDDIPFNIKLLETKLSQAYYNVIKAKDGIEAIEKAKSEDPDIILMDVMMPNMDGFTATKYLKSNPETSHIPIIVVTALNAQIDKVKGLREGADDFITKPIDDYALLTRIKSILRFKIIADQLRLRDQTSIELGLIKQSEINRNNNISNADVLVIDDDVIQARKIITAFEILGVNTDIIEYESDLFKKIKDKNYDLIIVNSQLLNIEALRLCSQIKSMEILRNVPILIIHDDAVPENLIKALEIGVSDYILIPINLDELIARASTQIKQKKYQDLLRYNYKNMMSLAIKDDLTNLYNIRYFQNHTPNMLEYAKKHNKNLVIMMLDIDHFKNINDTYGHQCGDEVLKAIAENIINNVRSTDLCARYGGEEFIIALPDATIEQAVVVALRIRQSIASTDFLISANHGTVRCSVSIGISTYNDENDTIKVLIRKADSNLYLAKSKGRNQVIYDL